MTPAPALLLLVACGAPPKAGDDTGPQAVDADGDGTPAGEDCADGDADIHPGAEERCNGLDDDCDGAIDEEAVDAPIWYPDRDADGYGDAAAPTAACQAPEGGIARGGDCDDTTATVHPDQEEACNGRDDDCDGQTDEPGAADEASWFADADGDGFGDPGASAAACTAPAGHVQDDTDCDDSDPAAFPGATERCGSGALEACELSPAEVFALCGPGGEGTVATARAVLDGATPGDRAGDRVAAAGDLDGDGTPDLLIGSVLADAGGTGAGAAWVVSGTTTGVQELGAGALAVVMGSAPGDGLGAALLGPGDLDGDGHDDLLLGATGGGEGWVQAVLGPLDGPMDADDRAWAIWTAPDGSGAGAALTAGAFGPAGATALVIGAPGTDGGGVYIVPTVAAGGAALETQPLWAGGRTGAQAGATVAPAGDVDGDGLSDLLVGALTDDRGAPNGGVAFLLRGPLSAGGSLEDADALIRGTRTGAALSGGLGGPGDLDGDGLDDILVGAYADSTAAVGAGAAYLFAGPLSGDIAIGSARATLLGQHRGDALGQELAGPGDVNGDGVPDLALGSPAADRTGPSSGATFVFLGPLSGTRSAETADAILTGISAGGRVGAAVAFVPDLDGDGTDELLLGGPAVSPGTRTSAGAAYLVGGGGP